MGKSCGGTPESKRQSDGGVTWDTPGICRMNSLVGSHVWWPKMDADLEKRVWQCEVCQVNRNLPPAPLHPWEWPHKLWVRLHVDFAGPFLDAHSKWVETFPMTTLTSSATIEKLRIAFTTHGLPEMVVTDSDSRRTSVKVQTGYLAFYKSQVVQFHSNLNLKMEERGEANKVIWNREAVILNHLLQFK